jgi:hypothetical protein
MELPKVERVAITMMTKQAQSSTTIMGLDTHMILKPCLFARPTPECAPGHQPDNTPLCRDH